MSGRYYGEFEVGETIEHDKRRTITEADSQRFCDLTTNQQPLVCSFDRTVLSLKEGETDQQ